jgi:phosphinothricin tripeptide acetyl hydrolase
MKSGDIKRVREFLAGLPDAEAMSVAEIRAAYDQIGQQFPLPDAVSVTPTDAGGVKAEWAKPQNARPDAAILYFHGGGYVIGSPASHRHLVAALGRVAGVNALAADYRLSPEHPFPAAIEDAVRAYQWLLESGVAPDRIVIAGDSCGGGLTVSTLLSLRDRGVPTPAAGVCLSSWFDLTITAESYTTKAEVEPIITRESVTRWAQAYLQGRDARAPLASPLFADLKGLPPLLIQVGTDEVLLDDSTGLAAQAKAAGVDVTLEVWEEMIHVWHYFYPMLREGRDAIARVGEFVRAKIG